MILFEAFGFNASWPREMHSRIEIGISLPSALFLVFSHWHTVMLYITGITRLNDRLRLQKKLRVVNLNAMGTLGCSYILYGNWIVKYTPWTRKSIAYNPTVNQHPQLDLLPSCYALQGPWYRRGIGLDFRLQVLSNWFCFSSNYKKGSAGIKDPVITVYLIT